VSALGGEVELSPQQRKLVDLAARASLFLDHIDSWLMGQPELVVDRALIPALVQRREMADHLTRVLVQLGLERRPRKVQGLEEYVAERYTGNGAERRDEAPSPVGEGEAG
jgi:hypothetical protein